MENPPSFKRIRLNSHRPRSGIKKVREEGLQKTEILGKTKKRLKKTENNQKKEWIKLRMP